MQLPRRLHSDGGAVPGALGEGLLLRLHLHEAQPVCSPRACRDVLIAACAGYACSKDAQHLDRFKLHPGYSGGVKVTP